MKMRTIITTMKRASTRPFPCIGMIKAQTLTIGDRKGEFPGMLENRSFRVVFVRENHGVGVNASDEPDKVVQYSGKQINVSR